MRWCLEDASNYADAILDRILTGDEANVPVLWFYEVVSVLTKSQLKRSITSEKAIGFLEDLRYLEVVVDNEGVESIFSKVYQLAVQYSLSGYDASYLELALRKGLPLASLDEDLNATAIVAGVELIRV